jgi:hypothetical protein
MSDFLNFCSMVLSYFLMPISLADTETTYQSCIQVWRHVFLFDKAKEKAIIGNREQIYRVLMCLAYLKTYLLQSERLWVSIEHPLNACECTWMPLSDCEQPLNTHWVCMNANEWVGTAPEHPLSAHERHWVSVNTQWVCMTAIESLLNATHRGVTMRKITFVWDLNSPLTWSSVRNACEWVLNTPWMLLSARECLWVSVEHPLNASECTWMRLTENWTAPEHQLSVHERLWVSISKVWMRTSRVVNFTTL